MNIAAQLSKYCQPFSRYERCFMNRKWLDLRKYIQRFPIAVEKVYSTSSSPSFELELLRSIIKSLVSIKNKLIETNMNNQDNFISACSAYISLLTIFLANCKPSFPDMNNKLDNLINYVLLYITVDHTLDSNPQLLTLFKIIFQKIIKNKDYNEDIGNDNNVKIAVYYLKNIIQSSPQSVPYIIKAASSEFKSVEIQGNKHDTLKTCYDKGETSATAGCSVLTDGHILNGCEIMGRLGQLFDDIIDVGIDMNSNFQTFATQCYIKDGNVDTAITVFAQEFDKLPFEYDGVKSVMLYVISTILLNSEFISEDMRLTFQKYSLLLYNGGYHSESLFYFI